MEPCVIVPPANMAAIAMRMVIIRILVLVHQSGMDQIVSMRTACLPALITHAVITGRVIRVVPMDFIVIVPMGIMVNSVSIPKRLHVLLHHVKAVEHVLIRLTLSIAHVQWVIMEYVVKHIRDRLLALLHHVLIKLHAMTMEPTIPVSAVVDIME